MNKQTKEFLTKLADLMQEYEATIQPIDCGSAWYPIVDGIAITTGSIGGWSRTEMRLGEIEHNHENIREQIK